MQQLINALLKYKNYLLYFGLLFLSILFLNKRSFYHQSIFSDISLYFSGNVNFLSQGIINYFSLAKINSQLRLENEKLKIFELAFQQKKEKKIDVFESLGFKIISARIIRNSYSKARNYLVLDLSLIHI